MLERFTGRARRAVVLAHEEARMLGHDYIGTEHILLGLIRECDAGAARALESLGISLEAVRQQVEEVIGQGQPAPSGHIAFTPQAKKVLELSLREALQLGRRYIGTGHILLGLIRVGEGVAAQVLAGPGADLNRVRQQVIQLPHDDQGTESADVSMAVPERGKAIGGLLDQHGWQQRAAIGSVFGRWAQIVGPALAAHTRPDSFADGELAVTADSTAWATQVRLLAPQLVRRLAAELGDGTVRRVKVRGPAPP
jgi:ATP-dependent Clp protease ATP-binding subunit ClpA